MEVLQENNITWKKVVLKFIWDESTIYKMLINEKIKVGEFLKIKAAIKSKMKTKNTNNFLTGNSLKLITVSVSWNSSATLGSSFVN